MCGTANVPYQAVNSKLEHCTTKGHPGDCIVLRIAGEKLYFSSLNELTGAHPKRVIKEESFHSGQIMSKAYV